MPESKEELYAILYEADDRIRALELMLTHTEKNADISSTMDNTEKRILRKYLNKVIGVRKAYSALDRHLGELAKKE